MRKHIPFKGHGMSLYFQDGDNKYLRYTAVDAAIIQKYDEPQNKLVSSNFRVTFLFIYC
jgi:hypothetical protein